MSRSWTAALALLLSACSAPAPKPAVAWRPDWVTAASPDRLTEFRTFESPAAGGRVSYHILLPADYERDGGRRYPVLYWLHGSGGGLSGIPTLARSFRRAMESGEMPAAIVVLPNGLPNGMYCDWKDGSVRVERVVVDDLVPHIDATYRTIASRSGRIVEGFSMGGYGAARLGFKYPELFGAVSMLAAGPVQRDFSIAPRAGPVRREQILEEVYGGSLAYFLEVSPWSLAERNARELRDRVAIRIAVGDRDATLPANRELHAHLEALGVPHEFTVVPGLGHDPEGMFARYVAGRCAFYRAAWQTR